MTKRDKAMISIKATMNRRESSKLDAEKFVRFYTENDSDGGG